MGNTKTILIVDDDIHFQILTQRLVGQMGHTVLSASNGSEALRILYTTKIDILLLDLNLGNTGISGWDILYITHNDDKLKDLPIAIVSNAVEDQLNEYVQKVQTPGGSKTSPRITMTKPVNRQDLLRFMALVETESKK